MRVHAFTAPGSQRAIRPQSGRYVCFWPLAGINDVRTNVRFRGVKRTSLKPAECPLMTQSPQDRCQERINVRNKSMNTRAVTMAAPVRKVMYRKTLNIETWSESSISQ